MESLQVLFAFLLCKRIIEIELITTTTIAIATKQRFHTFDNSGEYANGGLHVSTNYKYAIIIMTEFP